MKFGHLLREFTKRAHELVEEIYTDQAEVREATNVTYVWDSAVEINIKSILKFAQDYAAALSRRAAEQQEPVGWQHRLYYDDTAAWSEWRPGKNPGLVVNRFEERPLFVSPQPPVPAGSGVSEDASLRAGVEKLVAELKRWDTFVFGGNAAQQGGVGIMKTKMLERLSALLNGGSNGR